MHSSKRIRKVQTRIVRLANRVVFFPLQYVGNSKVKTSIQKFILSTQNSIPVEFVLNKGDSVVQVGTPWPRTVSRLRSLIGDSGTLVVIEANPNNYKTLSKHVDISGYSNVFVIEGAACNESKKGQLMISPHPGDHKINVDGITMDNDMRTGNEEMKQLDVQFLKIDDVLKNLGIENINYLSITVNGAEVEALKGAEKTLTSTQGDTRVFAKGHALNVDGQPINKDIEKLMKSLGYNSMISRGEQSSADDGKWNTRDGDVFAWKLS